MLIAWHSKRWWHFCMSEDEKKEIKLIFLSNAFNVYNMEVLKHLDTKIYIWHISNFSCLIFENIKNNIECIFKTI